MAVWQNLDSKWHINSPEQLFEQVLRPLVRKFYVIEDQAIQRDAIYLLVCKDRILLTRRILIVQYQLDGKFAGFRILEEHDQPLNFHCPFRMIERSCNKEFRAFEWRDAHRNLSLQRKIASAIPNESQHLANNFKTMHKWRETLRKGMVIHSQKYGDLIFQRVCPSLTQFIYVKDSKRKELYCHYNEFSFDEIEAAINAWTPLNLKLSIGF